jgi:protein-S-isoprenylcysteine O-methyltransferase Ste14
VTTSRDSVGVRIPPPVITLVCVLVGVALDRILSFPFLPEHLRAIERAAGWIVLLLAIALGLWATGLFVRAGTTPNPMRPTTALVIRGPYHFTRNPMYVSFALMMAGIGLITNNVWILLMIIPDVIATQVMQIDREERYLSEKFGAEYDAYRARVRRWL